MTYESGFGDFWQGLLADGYLNLEVVAREYQKQCGRRMRGPYTAIVDLIAFGRRQQEAQKKCEFECVSSHESSGCKARHENVRYRPICEHYVLSIKGGKPPTTGFLVDEYTRTVIEELADSAHNRFTILTLSNCKELEKCTKQVLKQIDFAVRPRRAYKNYKKFSRAAAELIERSIEFFEAPCVELMNNLKSHGFGGDHGYYP